MDNFQQLFGNWKFTNSIFIFNFNCIIYSGNSDSFANDSREPVGRNKRGFRTLRRMSLNAFGADFGTYGAMRKKHLLRPTGWANFGGVASSGGKCDSKVLKN